jgi:hypothetical protein
MKKHSFPLLFTAILWSLLGLAAAQAEETVHNDSMVGSGKLLATGGVSQLEGAGGGGLVPWALITGYGTQDQIGANVHYTGAYLSDFTLNSGGIAVGLYDRLELSYTHQSFDTRSAGGRLGLGKGFTFDQDIYGAKVRVWGNAVFDQDRFLPQIAVGLQYKSNDSPAIIHAVGGKSSDGVDFYVSATKILLAQSLLLNVTLRETKANQFGLLGFGGDKNNAYTTQFEGSAALLLSRQLAVGGELRTKPDNLGFAREGIAGDVFLAYFFNKNLSATLAYVNLGDIALQRNQDGVYLSLQAGF